ncbi:MAG TPA: VanZ family protein [Ignavibacteriaceae bacterium]|nr:VanZ family protein [Ignavibacteriaceae bacterium]
MLEYLKKNKIYLVYLPLGVYWLTLFIATSIPTEYIPSVGVSDKLNHFFAYLVLSVLLYLTFIFQEKAPFLREYPATFTLLIGSVYGIIDELHQLLIPGRHAEVLDWIADFIGVIAGVIIVKLLFLRINNKNLKNS